MAARAKQPKRQDARQWIRDAGLRATGPRVAVLHLLAGAKRPLSHSEVVTQLGSDEWDQATLYRNLVKLTEVNLVRVASRVGGIARYEYRSADDNNDHNHPHFSCSGCGAVNCLPGVQLSESVDPKWRASVREAELQVVGTCPTCRRSAKESKRGGSRSARA